MKKGAKLLLPLILIIVLFFAPKISTFFDISARSGCCSHHGGVCGCGCCDGSSLSSTCAPYYPECSKKAPTVVYTPKPTIKPTIPQTVRPTVVPTVSPTLTSTPSNIVNPINTRGVKGVSTEDNGSGGYGVLGVLLVGGILFVRKILKRVK